MADNREDTIEYNGEYQRINVDRTKINVQGTVEAIYPGSYTIVCTPKEGNTWEDGTSNPVVLTWKITPKKVTIPQQSEEYTYNGKKKTVRWTPSFNNQKISYISGDQEATNAGRYTVTIALPDNPDGAPDDISCFMWSDGSTSKRRAITWEIKGAPATEQTSTEKPHFEGSEWIYDGDKHAPTIVGNYTEAAVTVSNTEQSEVGQYTSVIELKDNYIWPDGTAGSIRWTWKIKPAQIKKPTLSKSEFEYKAGTSRKPTWNDYKQVTVSGIVEATEVGMYTIGFTPHEGCEWEDGGNNTIYYNWYIVPATIEEAPIVEPMEANGEEQEAKILNAEDDMFIVAGETSSSEPGTHYLLVTPTNNYRWADGTQTTREVPYEIVSGEQSNRVDPSNDVDTLSGGDSTPPKSTSPYIRESKAALEEKRQEIVQAMKEVDGDLKRTLHANGVFYLEDMKFNDSFYRYPRNDPFNYVDGAREYLFFTKPDLPLVHDGNASGVDSFLTAPAKNIPYFTDLAESPGYRKSVFCNLSYSGVKRSDGCPFMRILSNRKVSNMDVPDLQVEELETAVNMYGTKILYPKSSSSSDEGVDFNIEFQDTRFCEIYHLFKVWDYYRTLKWYGVVSPASFLQEYGENKTDRTLLDSLGHAIKRDVMESTHSYSGAEGDYVNYLFYKVLHDHIRVFKFLIDNDGETVLYAASAIGCYPKTIQRSAFSEIPERGPLNINIGFKVSGWFEDDITSVVQDFNAIVGSWKSRDECYNNEWPIYDPTIGFVSQELVDVPFIVKVSPVSESEGNPGRNTEFARYLFKWARFDSKSGTNQNYNIEGAESTGTYTSYGDQRDGDTSAPSEPLTNIMAPNGKMVTQNDWDYLANQNYDDDAIRTMLFTSDKYKDPNLTV